MDEPGPTAAGSRDRQARPVLVGLAAAVAVLLAIVVIVWGLVASSLVDRLASRLMPTAIVLVAWAAAGLPVLARSSRAPARDGVIAGALFAGAVLVVAYSMERGSDHPVAMYVWWPVALAALGLASGAVAGLVVHRLRGAGPGPWTRGAAGVALACAPVLVGATFLAYRWFDPSFGAREPDVPVGEVLVAVGLALAGAALALRARPRRTAG